MGEEKPTQIEIKFDEKWYSRFSEIASRQDAGDIHLTNTDRDIQKERFMNGQIENPQYNYKIDTGKLDEYAASYFELKRDIIKNEPNETVAQAYRWKINEKIAETFLLKSAAEGDMRKFKKWSEFIYGKPSKDVFDYTIKLIKEKIALGLQSENTEIQTAAKNLQDAIGDITAPANSITLPEHEDEKLALKTTLNEFKDVIDIGKYDPDKKFNAEEIKTFFEESLKALNLAGWTVIIEKEGIYINVVHEDKTVRIPETGNLKAKYLNNLILHEIATHVLRRENGERSRLMLLGLGLDRYLPGEEGIATAREQAFEGGLDDFAELGSHLAISLAYGYLGKPLDFKGTYEVMEKYYILKLLLKSKDFTKSRISAKNNAWKFTTRVFQGTDFKTPGVCFTKYIVYREGNISVWDVIHKNPDEMHRFSLGKYDPANNRHMWILSQLGISDEDLQTNSE